MSCWSKQQLCMYIHNAWSQNGMKCCWNFWGFGRVTILSNPCKSILKFLGLGIFLYFNDTSTAELEFSCTFIQLNFDLTFIIFKLAFFHQCWVWCIEQLCFALSERLTSTLIRYYFFKVVHMEISPPTRSGVELTPSAIYLTNLIWISKNQKETFCCTTFFLSWNRCCRRRGLLREHLVRACSWSKLALAYKLSSFSSKLNAIKYNTIVTIENIVLLFNKYILRYCRYWKDVKEEITHSKTFTPLLKGWKAQQSTSARLTVNHTQQKKCLNKP